MTDAETGRGHKPKNTWSHQKLKGTRDGFSPRASRGHVGLSTPSFHMSGLQDMRIHFCCYKPPSWG